MNLRATALAMVIMAGFPCQAAQDSGQKPAEAPAPAWSATVGAALSYSPKYLGSGDHWLRLPPLFVVEYRHRFYVEEGTTGVGGSAGWYMVRKKDLEWSVAGELIEARAESRGALLAGMGDRPTGPFLSTTLTLRQGILEESVSARRGVTNGEGANLDARVGLRRGFAVRWFFTGGARATAADAVNMGYDFGVTGDQAARRRSLIQAGRTHLKPAEAGPYSPGGGFKSVGVDASLGFYITRSARVLALVSRSRLLGDAASGPLTGDRLQFSAGAGFLYDF